MDAARVVNTTFELRVLLKGGPSHAYRVARTETVAKARFHGDALHMRRLKDVTHIALVTVAKW
jgi:hypothetical protein